MPTPSILTKLSGVTNAPQEPAQETVAVVEVEQPKRGGFKPGHPKFGGRKPGSKNKRTKAAQEMAMAMGVDPVKFMLGLLRADSVQVVQTNPVSGEAILDEAGQPKRIWVPVPLDLRLDAAKAVAAYVHPKLQATQLTGPNDAPLDAGVDVDRMLQDPATLEAAQKVALAITGNEQESQPEPDEGSDDDQHTD